LKNIRYTKKKISEKNYPENAIRWLILAEFEKKQGRIEEWVVDRF